MAHQKRLAAGLATALALTLATLLTVSEPRLLLSSATATAAPAQEVLSAAAPGEVFNRTELYFGSQRPGGRVTPEQFDTFVDFQVTPRFPDGLTLLTGEGQFRNASGRTIEERSFVLVLLYPLNDGRANMEIEAIRRIYKRNFDQESVLRVDSRERVSF